MIMMPIWLSIETMKPECRPVVQSKENHGTTSATASAASHGHSRRSRAARPPRASAGAAARTGLRSCVAGAHQPARLDQQHEDQHQVGQQRADPGQGDRQHLGERRGRGDGDPQAASRSAKETSSTTAKVCTRPMTSEAMKQPASEPRPPNTTTTKTIGPMVIAIDGSVTR